MMLKCFEAFFGQFVKFFLLIGQLIPSFNCIKYKKRILKMTYRTG